MILTAIITVFGVFLAVFAAFLAAYLIVLHRIKSILHDITTPKTTGGASPFAEFVSVCSSVFASEIVANLKSTFMGVQSVESKNSRKIESELLIGSNPLLNVILQAFPAVARRIKNNPSLAGLAVDIASKVLSKGGTSTGSVGNGGSNPIKFDNF